MDIGIPARSNSRRLRTLLLKVCGAVRCCALLLAKAKLHVIEGAEELYVIHE